MTTSAIPETSNLADAPKQRRGPLRTCVPQVESSDRLTAVTLPETRLTHATAQNQAGIIHP